MKIEDLVRLIPDESTDEAIASIESIVVKKPTRNDAIVRCHLSQQFRLVVSATRTGATISAEGRTPVACSVEGFVSTLRRQIYEVDEAMAAGRYQQTPPKIDIIIPPPPPPAHMDLPTWDEKAGKWYDAEI